MRNPPVTKLSLADIPAELIPLLMDSEFNLETTYILRSDLVKKYGTPAVEAAGELIIEPMKKEMDRLERARSGVFTKWENKAKRARNARARRLSRKEKISGKL
jgi:hypothetical protein